jgi:hypothetical protein
VAARVRPYSTSIESRLPQIGGTCATPHYHSGGFDDDHDRG